MSNDSAYQSLHRLAKDLNFKVTDHLDDREHPTARALRDQLRYLEDDFETDKKPRNLEERIKDIMQLLDRAKDGDEPYMSVSHAVDFHDTFEDMRRDVREHPDYS
jgi:hypothetical protein